MFSLSASSKFNDTAFQHLQKSLLNSFVSRVGGNGIIFAGLARDFVELVQINNSVFRFLNIFSRRVIKISDGNFNVRTDKTRLR